MENHSRGCGVVRQSGRHTVIKKEAGLKPCFFLHGPSQTRPALEGPSVYLSAALYQSASQREAAHSETVVPA